MPLSDSVQRRKIHTREICCEAFFREDGLWDIEGRIVDSKTYDFANRDRGGTIKAGEALHDMSLRITVDEQLQIHHAEAVTDASPFNICPEIADSYAKLVGLRIGSGWRQQLRERVGGTAGCTHLTDLLAPMATTAVQAMKSGSRKALDTQSSKRQPPKQPPRRDTAAGASKIINRCYALSESGPVVREFFPKLYKGAPNKS